MAFVSPTLTLRRPRQAQAKTLAPQRQRAQARRAPCMCTPPPNKERGFRPHAVPEGNGDEDSVDVPLELVEGYLDNAKVRPKIDIDADEYMLMWKLRKMLHEDDFNAIFDSKSRRIGEL